MTHTMDGDLVRLMDGECDAPEREAIENHLGTCDACSGRYRAFGGYTLAVRAALPALDAPRSVAWRRPRWGLRAAAVLLAAGAVVGAVRPVRAWIVGRGEALWNVVTGHATQAALPTSPPAPAPTVRSASVAFVPAGTTFGLTVQSRQAAGSLMVEIVPGDSVVAAIAGGSDREDLMVLPSALRIANTPASAALYRVQLPARLRQVTLTIGDEPAVRLQPGTVGATWNVPLGPGGGAPVRGRNEHP